MHELTKTMESAIPSAANLIRNPTTLDRPAFLMNCPFSYSTQVPNNPWMTDLAPDKRHVDYKKAWVQFLELYRYVSSEALVCILPTPAACTLQDLVFTANLGIVLEHLQDKDQVVLSNFTSAPRRGEAEVGAGFFRAMGYRIHHSPFNFEGEAELKHLYDNVYVGGYGIRSDLRAYKWMERTFDIRVVKLCMTDPYLYHLDCLLFPVTREDTLVCTEMFSEDEIGQLEEHTNVIHVSADDCYAGICNSVRLTNAVLNSSHIHDLRAATQEYAQELAKNRKLEDITANMAFDVCYFNLSEYHKGGTLLSCMLMHLNRNPYSFSLA